MKRTCFDTRILGKEVHSVWLGFFSKVKLGANRYFFSNVVFHNWYTLQNIQADVCLWDTQCKLQTKVTKFTSATLKEALLLISSRNFLLAKFCRLDVSW